MATELEKFKEVVMATKKPVFAMVSASWCNPCKLIKPEFKAKSDTEKDNATFILIDADESPDLCSEFNVTAIPTVLVFKRSIPEVADVFSGSNVDNFNKFIKKHLSD